MDQEKFFYKFLNLLAKIKRRILLNKKKFLCELLEITTMILTDNAGVRAPAIYLVGQTSDNQNSIFNKGREFWRKGLVASILIDDGETEHGYPGFEAWKRELLRMGVTEETILPLKFDGNLNTLTEAQALIRYARSREWKCIYISAAPFHQLRAFITLVSVVLREYPELAVYNAVGTHLDWFATACHSQGTLVATRQNLIRTELKKIYDYHLKGDLVSPAKILAYLQRRNQK